MAAPARRLIWFIVLWGIAAELAGRYRAMEHLRAWGPPVVIAVLIVGFNAAIRWIPSLGAGVRSFSLRQILAIHLLRFVGIYFLWLEARGRLPAAFAERAGWGDIAAAVGAVGLLLWRTGPGFAPSLLAWNIFGLLDLAVAVGTAGWLNATRPGSMAEIAGLPLALIPLWLVPILVTSHFELLRRRA